MILTINPLLPSIYFQILDEKEILENFTLEKDGKEFSTLPEFLVDAVMRKNIDEVWCIVWPWPFTLMRILTLSLNTLALTHEIKLRGISFFDFYAWKNIPLLQINDREYLIRDNDSLKIMDQKSEIQGTYEGIFQKNDFTDLHSFIEWKEIEQNWREKLTNISPKQQLDPLYFKPPNITTWSKKST